eukprot:14671054-Ditylum_brightwellii.AAC.1
MELELHSWMQEEYRYTGAMLQHILSENTIALYIQPLIIAQASYGTASALQFTNWFHGDVLSTQTRMTIKLLP